MNRFPLLELQFLPFENFASYLENIDLLSLFLTSKRMGEILNLLKWKAKWLDLTIQFTDFHVTIWTGNEDFLKWVVTTEKVDVLDKHFHCREKIGTILLGGKRFENNSKISALNKIITVVRAEDRFDTLRHITNWLMTQFPGAYVHDVHLDLGVCPHPKELMEWEVLRSCRTFELTGGLDAEREYLLDQMHITSLLTLRTPFEDGFQHEKLLTIPRLFVPENSSIPKEVFLSRDCQHLSASEIPNLEPSDVVDYIRKWKDGVFNNMESLQLVLEKKKVQEIYTALTNAFVWVKYPEDFQPTHFKYTTTNLISFKCASYLTRDGKFLTMFNTNDRFLWFYVFNGAIPQYRIQKGYRQLSAGPRASYVFLKKLTPEVFKTEAAAMEEMAP